MGGFVLLQDPRAVVRNVKSREPMTEAISPAKIRSVIRELEQVAVAVAVVGTKRPKLLQLARMAQGVADEMVGTRPKVRRVRGELLRRIQDVKVSPTKAASAARSIRRMALALKETQKLLKTGVGTGEADFEVGKWLVTNTWGYTGTEVKALKRTLDKARRVLRSVGLDRFASGQVVLDPKIASGQFAIYLPMEEVVAMDLGQAGSKSMDAILRAIAGRLWLSEMNAADVETWGGIGRSERFEQAFSKVLDGGKVDRDTAARLRMTVGRMAKKWDMGEPEKVGESLDDALMEARFAIGTVRVWKIRGKPVKMIKTGHRDWAPVEREGRKHAKELKDVMSNLVAAIEAGGVRKKGKFHKLAPGMSAEDHIADAKRFLGEHKEAFDETLGRLQKAFPGAIVYGRVKTLESAISKILRKPEEYKKVRDLDDGAGMRVVRDSIM